MSATAPRPPSSRPPSTGWSRRSRTRTCPGRWTRSWRTRSAASTPAPSVVHHHNGEPNFGGPARHSARPYIDAWTRLRAVWPGLLLHPTMPRRHCRFDHRGALRPCRRAPRGRSGAGGNMRRRHAGPGRQRLRTGVLSMPETFGNPAADVDWILRWHRERELPVHISIFEPGFLRLILAHREAGTLPPRREDPALPRRRPALFGLPATPGRPRRLPRHARRHRALTGWPPCSAATSSASGIAALAIEKGGHVRVGLEDHHAPPRLARPTTNSSPRSPPSAVAAGRPATVEEKRRGSCSAEGPVALAVGRGGVRTGALPRTIVL